ncbi:MAG: hypothetical protein AB7N91_30145 [Candidatus Tectimicrobiota bacterium]
MHHTAVPRRPHEHLHPRWARHEEQIIDVGFAIPDADEARLWTRGPGGTDGFQAREPRVAFFVGNGALLTDGLLPHGGRVPWGADFSWGRAGINAVD